MWRCVRDQKKLILQVYTPPVPEIHLCISAVFVQLRTKQTGTSLNLLLCSSQRLNSLLYKPDAGVNKS